MGKIDDMRRQREERMAQIERANASRPPTKAEPAAEARPKARSSPAAAATALGPSAEDRESTGSPKSETNAEGHTSSEREAAPEATSPSGAKRERSGAPSDVGKPSDGAPVPTSASSTSKTAKKNAPTEGKCSGCGKMRPVINGLVAQHQKGFGKACPGARKEPAAG